ncbi:MAG: translocase [Planctomycetes bacterium]|nr:translocase [Planctomycetota bacterium]
MSTVQMLRAWSPWGAVAGLARRQRGWSQVAEIERRGPALHSLSAADLLGRASDLRHRAWRQEPLPRLLPEAYALVGESIRRATGFTLHAVQLLGGITLAEGAIAQMQTGEGKTLTALLPAFLRALSGQGCHVVTVNDYLSQRDAQLASRVLEPLGLTVGWVAPEQDNEQRRQAYLQDVTYGTAREIGFDFLRDRLRQAGSLGHATADPGSAAPVQRDLHFALVDEADNVLIDDAKTPLIIALPRPHDEAAQALFRWSVRAAQSLELSRDFTLEPHGRAAQLTEAGCLRLIRTHKPQPLEGLDLERIYRQVERALAAQHGFQLDHQYVVTDGKLAIVDESTGRIMDGRKWQEGLHQAIEAKERLEFSQSTRTAAKITVQSFFRLYRHLAGMTGTAATAQREFAGDYGLPVARIPTHRPSQRVEYPPRLFATAQAKRQALAEAVEHWLAAGRAVLLGTSSVAASEALAAELRARNITCELLNCRAHDREAAIISEAGQPGRVTIATNMAGRGTDIHVHPEVLQAGGLHVVATEMHASRRIDLQLLGRTARQGEPGSCQFFLSLEDELLETLAPGPARRLRDRGQREASTTGEISARWLPVFRRLQSTLETRHRRQRRDLLKYERQRRKACDQIGFDPWLDVLESQ